MRVRKHLRRIFDADSASIFADVLQPDAHDGPIGAQRELVGPLDDHHRFLGEHILQAERFQIVEIADAVEVHVIDRRAALVFVDERESRAGHFVFAGRAQARSRSLL